MDLPQNGESSKSPFHLQPQPAQVQGAGPSASGERRDVDGDVEMSDGRADGLGPGEASASVTVSDEGMKKERGTARLILPQWDVPPPKPIHSSQDLISLLNLDTLYNVYVRPFADLPGEGDQPNGTLGAGGAGGDDGKGAGGKKKGPPGRRKMEKGYQHLVEDCIDPIPLGTRVDAPSFLPLLNDVLHPPAPPPAFEGGVEELPKEAFKVARLEAGSQEGYLGGQKAGVREAEEKRRRKRAARTATHDPMSPLQPSFPPNIEPTNGRSSTPGTPMLPVPPPINVRPYHAPGTPRRGTAPPGGTGQGVHPFSKLSGAGAGGRPMVPSSKQRPASMEVPHSRKAASRSASPLPPSSLGSGQQRPLAVNRNKRPGSADVHGGPPGKKVKENGSASPMPGR